MLAISPFSRLNPRRRFNGEHQIEWTIDIPSVGIEIDVVVEFDFRVGHPGQLSGPPERCFPPEPDEIEITSVVGLHSGVCCMEMLNRETVAVRPYFGYGPKTCLLIERLADDMRENAIDRFFGRD